AARLADGVVVGSALVAAAERAGQGRVAAVESLARSLAGACRSRNSASA
ncbi:MAG: tryptophan synthase subunit alpha, partial [Thermoanaerobaculia bacterium]